MQKLLQEHQRKWGGGIIPHPKSGGPIPLSPLLRRLWTIIKHFQHTMTAISRRSQLKLHRKKIISLKLAIH